MPLTMTNLSELTNGAIADLYFRSLANVDTRKSHVLLYPTGPAAVGAPGQPTARDMELDFTSWYGGVLAMAHAVDPGVDLPRTKEMCSFIGGQFERGKAALAA